MQTIHLQPPEVMILEWFRRTAADYTERSKVPAATIAEGVGLEPPDFRKAMSFLKGFDLVKSELVNEGNTDRHFYWATPQGINALRAHEAAAR